MLWSKIKAAAILALLLTLIGGIGYWQAPVFGGRAESRPGSSERKQASSSQPSKSSSSAEEAKRMELTDAEKLVRQYIFDENPKMNPAATFPLKELTTETVWKRLHVQVFKVKDGVRDCETYVIKAAKVFHIGQGFGGLGVTSLGVADLNKSGQPVLVYVFSWGSGIHRAHAAMFDVGRKEPKEYVAPQVYYSERTEDPALKVVDDQNVEIHLGDQKLGRLALEGKEGAQRLRLILEEKLPEEVRKRIRGGEEVKPEQKEEKLEKP